MRINNNMLAINTHRQMGGVALMQAKSMEKLSSGYRINRAGDDAAGLAISEKMRAQIRGLHTAAKNAQDGISLIQTAEGSLQEVHSMLNRMVELATQSANGTFDDAVDRKNLESEVIALKDEIDRVAKSSNFNGIKLLDGSLASSAVKNKIADVVVHGVTGQNTTGGVNDVITVEKASESKFVGSFVTGQATGDATLKFAKAGDTIKSTVKFRDESGTLHTLDINLVSDGNKKIDKTKSTFTLNGKDIKLNSDFADSALDNDGSNLNTTKVMDHVFKNVDELKKLFKVELKKADGKTAPGDATVANNKAIKVEAKATGTKAEVVSILLNQNADVANAGNSVMKDVALIEVQNVKEDKITVDGTKMFSLANKPAGVTLEDINTATVQVNGEKFIFVNKADKGDAAVIEALKNHGFDEAHIVYSVEDQADNTSAAMNADDVKAFVSAINDRFGKKVAEAGGTNIVFKGENKAGAATEGLTLQVGDTADDFQKISVKVNDMSSLGLGISNVSVADQLKAADSIKYIKDAINTVSSTRGDLGALQNRLEHTIANINTTAENITASESRIRDVDMAKEMVELTKANILQQAAQAMLAQANQAPQGVLQLLR